MLLYQHHIQTRKLLASVLPLLHCYSRRGCTGVPAQSGAAARAFRRRWSSDPAGPLGRQPGGQAAPAPPKRDTARRRAHLQGVPCKPPDTVCCWPWAAIEAHDAGPGQVRPRLADTAYGNKTLRQVRATRPDVHTDTVALGIGVAVTWKQAMSISRYISRIAPCGQPLCSYQEALLKPWSLSLLTQCMCRSWIECSAA